MVTVTGVVSDVDWFDNTYENQGQTAGLIVADNGKELLILVDAAAIRQAEELEGFLLQRTECVRFTERKG